MTQNSRWLQPASVWIGLASAIAFQPSAAFAGSLVLTGGNWAFPGSGGEAEPYGISIYDEIVERAGGLKNAKIGIISTASSNPEESAGFYLEDFDTLYGDAADVEWIPIARDTCDGYKNDQGSAVAAQIKDRNGFIFTGGDQSFITDCFFNENPKTQTRTDTALIKALRSQFDAGAVIAGTSAGTAVQPTSPMITNGESYEALRDGSVSLVGSPPFDNTLYYNPLGGLGFFEYGLIDSHFSERGRQGRLIRLASDLGVDMAYGVDENTALVVTNAGTAEAKIKVLGEGGVFISDLAEAEVGEKNGDWTISDVLATYLTEGDQFDPVTKTALFGDKSLLVGLESQAVPLIENVFSHYNDDLGDWTNQRSFTDGAIALFNSEATTALGESFESDPTYGVTLTKLLKSQAFSGLDSQGNPKVSFENLAVDVAPVPEPGSVLGIVGLFGIGLTKLRQKL